MTTGISLVRENTASMQPPRALWVSFPLGRPLGKPQDSAFQHRVIKAALDLFNKNKGPLLEDYPEDAPEIEIGDTPACPVTFSKPNSNAPRWEGILSAEVTALMPWHDLGRRRKKGRTLVGLSAFSVKENAVQLGQILNHQEIPEVEFQWLKAAIEDIKVFYLESMMAQPGAYQHSQIDQVFWSETQMGAAILALHDRFAKHDQFSGFARIIAPRTAVFNAKKSRDKLPKDTQ
jgi:D-proline reductase (dithiol) PrdB